MWWMLMLQQEVRQVKTCVQDREPRKAKSVVDREKEECLKKSMVEIIQ
jgi:hypothetical protein